MPEEMDVRVEELRLVPPSGEEFRNVVESGSDPDVVVESGGEPPRIAGPGSQIVISFRLVPVLPFRGRWVAEILEYESLSYFLDQQCSGPMRSWRHRHSFRPDSRNGVDGTVVRDEVEYELPFGVLGRMADALVVERMMQRTFTTRQKQLEGLLSLS
jgi:ligand-binding SRPBCC domain-containing protein